MPAIEAAILSDQSCLLRRRSLRCSQHLTLVIVVVGLLGDLWQPVDRLLKRPARKDVGERVRSLVRGFSSAELECRVGGGNSRR